MGSAHMRVATVQQQASGKRIDLGQGGRGVSRHRWGAGGCWVSISAAGPVDEPQDVARVEAKLGPARARERPWAGPRRAAAWPCLGLRGPTSPAQSAGRKLASNLEERVMAPQKTAASTPLTREAD